MEVKLKTRDKILLAARKEFQKNGFNGTRMQKIADEANINKGLLHYYFKSKDKIFEEILNETFILIFSSINEVLSSDIDLFTKLKVFVNKYMDILMENAFAPNFVIQEINRNPEFVKEKILTLGNFQGLKTFSRQVNLYKEEGKIIDIDPRELLINLISLSLMPFVAAPMIKGIMKYDNREFENLMKMRKETVSLFIINAIKKD